MLRHILRIALPTLVLLCLLPAPHAAAQCSSMLSGGSGFNNIHFINVTSAGTPYDGSIGGAMNMWNSACGGMSGSDYPAFQFGNQSGGGIQFLYVNGHEPTPNCGGYCGAHYDPSTRAITLYEDYGPDLAHLSHFNALDPQQRRNLMAHELGHALGLADDFCNNGLMNQTVPYNASITGEECVTADQGSHVMYEGTSNQGCESLQDCHMSPIILDLDRATFQLTSVAGGVLFDLNGDGLPEETAWTRADRDEAFLWLDRNGNGVVDDGTELFGSSFGDNGFIQLAAWDKRNQGDVVIGGNEDDRIDAGDAVWPRLRLWIDRSHDGISQADEIFTLAQKGVTSIDLRYYTTRRHDTNGNYYRYGSRAIANGKPLFAVDVYFKVGQ